MGLIRVLPEDVISKIAAGEVVERPASVVKELVENSLDAGADRITVEVTGAGMEEIRVSDNGCGMSREDAAMAFMRHATSKIRNLEDIERIGSFGFRGEALAAIAAVARVEVLTCAGPGQVGTRAVVVDGQIESVEDCGLPVGTTIAVRELFLRTPARRKFLKSPGTEMGRLVEAVSRLAAGVPETGFTVRSGGRDVLASSPGEGLDSRIASIYGRELAEGLVRVDAMAGSSRVSGRVGKPGLVRRQPDRQLFFVNRRPVIGRMLSHAVAAAHETILPRGQHAVAFVFIEVDMGQVDVNVHPTKREVRFAKEGLVHDAIVSALRKALERTGAPGVPEAEARASGVREAVARYFTGGVCEERELSLGATVKEPGAEGARFAGPTGRTNARPGETGRVAVMASQARARGRLPVQIARSYVLVENEKGLVLVDQHAAHERIIYERLAPAGDAARAECQLLLVPVELELAPDEWATYEECADTFSSVGINAEPFGSRTLLVRGIPAAASRVDARWLVESVLSDVKEARREAGADITHAARVSLACRSAIKAGEELTQAEMEGLLSDLGKCRMSHTCPHGRPVSTLWSIEEIEKRFRRR